MAKTAMQLAGSGLSLEQYDANLDFFVNHLLTSEELNTLVSLIKQREKQGAFKQADSQTVSLLADLAADPKAWERKIADAGHTLALFKTDDFFQPDACLTACNNLNAFLELASLAFYPSRIQWGRFTNRSVTDQAGVKAFLEDYDTNPFLSVCSRGLKSRIARPELKFLVLCASAPDQVLAALTMARFCKKERPDLHVALMGDPGLAAAADDYTDTLLLDSDLNPLFDLIAGPGGQISSEPLPAPDFSTLPLTDYLAPALVLPLDLSVETGDELMLPSRYAAAMEAYRTTYGAEGFLVVDDHLKPAHITDLVAETAADKSSVGLGLSWALDESIAPNEIDAVHQAGGRLIQWRAPAGQFKSLTQILWNISKAGIWNHVMMPEESEKSLDQELVHFMAANPNIVHSWTWRQPSNAVFSSPVDQPMEPASYTQVAELPGRPFWHILNDPAHLLLYLNKHGVKKIIRWQIRDDRLATHTIGKDISFHFVKPQELPPSYMDEICRMIEAGGSVETTLVRHNLEKAFMIGYALEQGVIVGNSTLKHPRMEYIQAVNEQSGLDLTHYLERGYTSVRPEYRGMGIGAKLLEGLTERVGNLKLFAIIGADNIAAQKMAMRNQTKHVATFYSQRLDKEVGVWIPAWMLEP